MDAALHATITPIVDGLTTVNEIITVTDSSAEAPATLGTPYEELLERGSVAPLPWAVDG